MMAPTVRKSDIQAPSLFEFKKNPGPLQSVLVTAVAAASAVLNSDINVFKVSERDLSNSRIQLTIKTKHDSHYFEFFDVFTVLNSI
jgi:hypothetical protein